MEHKLYYFSNAWIRKLCNKLSQQHLLSIIAIFVISFSSTLHAQNITNPVGFEDGTVNGWLGGGSTETAAVSSTASQVRTGTYSLALATTSTSTNKNWYANVPYALAGNGNTIHFIYWAMCSTSGMSYDASMRYVTAPAAPPSGTGSTANQTSATLLTTTGWTQVSYDVTYANTTRVYFPSPRRQTGTTASTMYMDDVVFYISSSATSDLTDPGTPSALAGTPTGNNVALSWTSNTDAGTGVQATLILRTSNLTAPDPVFNDQGQYSVAGGAAGPNTIGSWTIISDATSGTATSYADNGLSNGTYKYAVVLRDLAYNYSIAAVSGTVAVGGPSPVITLTPGSFTGSFGNTVVNTTATSQQYNVAGSNLSANIIINAPSGFKVSTNATTGFGSTVTLTPTAGTVASTPVFAQFAPTTASGTTGSLNITNASTGATTQNVAVSGNALAVEPTTAGNITFSSITNTSVVLNLPTIGNGSNRIIVARAGSAVSFMPADGVAMTGVSTNFTTAADQGSGNKIVYDGTGSGSNVLTVSGLTTNALYYFTVYEYNVGNGTSQNYLLTPVAAASVTATLPTPTILVNQTSFSGTFGNVVTGTSGTAQLYTVSGTGLTADITITAPAGFQVSGNSTAGFGGSMTLTQVGGVVAVSNVYVRFSPTAASGATGSLTITNVSTGATTQNVTLNGNALAIEPTAAGTMTFGTLTTTSIVINLPTTGNGTNRIIVAKQGIAPTFTPTDAIAATGVNANFTTATDQGGANKIMYDGTGSGNGVVTVSGLTPGTLYYFTVYEYNVGTGTSQNYSLSPVVTASASTAGLPTPTITLNQTGFTGVFGNVVATTNSANQQYSVSGSGLTNDILLTAPAGFQISTNSTTGFGSTITLTQSGGIVASTSIYVRYTPAAATGATGSLSIAHTSTGATAQNVTITGNAIAAEPTTAGTITFGTITNTTIVLNLPTIGNGSNRIIVARAASAVSFTPADGVAMTGVNANFTTATDQGSGNKVVYDGTGSGSNVVTVSGLTTNALYYFTVYEYNVGTGTSQNYLLSPVATASVIAVLPPPVITVNQAGFNGAFGNVVSGSNSANQSFIVSGINLTTDITVTAPVGFQVSTNSTTGFGSSVVLTQTAGIVAATTVYVRFAPTAATGATGTLNITSATTGGTTQNTAISGNALSAEPTTAGTISFGTITGTSIVVNLPTVGDGTRRIIVAKAANAVTFIPADGVAMTGVNAAFTTATDQGSGNKIVYDGTGSGNSVVTVTGLANGTSYYFTVYEYNVGTGTSHNYLAAPAATGNTATITPVPAIVITPGTFSGNFGNVVTATNSATQFFTISGSNLSTAIVLAPPASFQVSTSATTGFTSTLSLPQTGGNVANTIIYVRYSPTAATGATGSVNISITSTGATTQTVGVNGNALAVKPTTTGTITFGTIGSTILVINLPTVGNGNNRIIVANQGSAPTFTPTDGVAASGVNANFSAATDQGNGNKIVYDGNGSGANLFAVTGLSIGTAYYFKVYEYNVGTGTSQSYLLTPAANANTITLIPPPTITINQLGFVSAFGNQVAGTSSQPQSYTVAGSGLTANMVITAPASFELSTNATTGFTNTLTFTPTGGDVPTAIVYVRYSPLLANGATGNLTITHTSAGAPTQTLAVSGNALDVEPTDPGTITFGAVGDSTIEVNLPTIGNGTRRFIVMHLGSPATYVPLDGPSITGIFTNDYLLATDQGNGSKIIYDGTGSGASVVTVKHLNTATLYYFTVYEYNHGTGTSYNYLTNPAAGNNMTTRDPTLSVANNAIAKQIKVYPNPARNMVNIDAPVAVNLVLRDAAGRVIYQLNNEHTITLESLPDGLYMLTILNAKGAFLKTERLVKQQ